MGMKKQTAVPALQPLNPLHYDEERVMIGHELEPAENSSDGVFWCRVCDGQPNDPIHQPGYIP